MFKSLFQRSQKPSRQERQQLRIQELDSNSPQQLGELLELAKQESEADIRIAAIERIEDRASLTGLLKDRGD